jgi:hypothetical protein
MTAARPDVRAFFENYKRAGEDSDGGALTGCFCEAFLSLDPTLATVVSPQALLAALPRRRQLFAAIGSDGLELADIGELPLDDTHTLVRASWNLRMRDPSRRSPVTLHSTFVLRREDGTWRIALYLNHQDLSKVLNDLAGQS